MKEILILPACYTCQKCKQQKFEIKFSGKKFSSDQNFAPLILVDSSLFLWFKQKIVLGYYCNFL